MTNGRRGRLAPWLAAALLLGCAPERASNLVLITVDTTRPDRLGVYGYDKGTSPNIDALAAESVVFDRAYSHVPITLPSHTSMMTGTVPLYHGVRDNGRFVVRDELVTLAEVAREAGYDTAAFVSAFVLDSRYGLDQGFELYDDEYSADWSEEDVRNAQLYDNMVIERRADQTTGRALQWLAGTTDPYFLWVHYYDPHERKAPPPPYDGMFGGDLYDGEIGFMDAQIGRLLEAVRARGDWAETTVVLTSDHGESLGQHGETTHAALAYDSTLHAALMVKAPRSAGLDPGRDDRSVSHQDLFPTVAGLLGWEVPAQVQGEALLTGSRDPRRSRPIYFECHLPRFGYGWEPLFGVRAEGWKYIHAPEREIYDIGSDPDELFNRADRTELVERYESLLFRVVDEESAPEADLAAGGELDADTRSKLAALGYVSGGPVTASELAPREPTGRLSPNQGVVFLTDYFAANSLVSRGRLNHAAALYEDVLLQLDPGNPSFWSNLAEIRRRTGDLDGALEALRRAQANDPTDAGTLVELGRLELDRRRPEEARELLAAALELSPENLSAAYFAARADAAMADHEAAVSGYRAALAIDPSHRDSRLQMAISLGELGRLEDAGTVLVELVRDFPLSARARYNLAIVRMRQERPAEAVEALRTTLRLQPEYPRAALALGVALTRAGERAEAREALEGFLARYPEGSLAAQARAALAELDPGA